jgi:hypothetical protein
LNAARIALFVVIALAVALTVNLVLLDIATGPKDPVGQLSPRAGIVRLPVVPATTTTTHTTITILPTPVPPRHGEGTRGSHQDD